MFNPRYALALIASVMMSGLALAEDNPLSADDIYAEIIGSELQGRRMGMTATILHAADGTSKIKAPFRTRTGVWEISGNDLCITWDGADEQDCVHFVRRGDSGYRIEPMGVNVTIKAGS